MNCVERAISPAPSAPSILEIEMLFRPSAAKDPARARDARTALEENSPSRLRGGAGFGLSAVGHRHLRQVTAGVAT